MNHIRALPDLTPAERFCQARQRTLEAWRALAEAQDVPAGDMVAEVEATANAMRQIPMVLG